MRALSASLLCTVAAALNAVATTEGGATCDADDRSCSADGPTPGSMLLQVDHSHKKDLVQSVARHASPGPHKEDDELLVEESRLALLDVSTRSRSMDFLRLAHRVAPNGFCTDHPCRATMLQSLPGKQLEKGAVGKTALLSQAGYEKVAALRDDTEMAEFIQRVIDKYDCKVTNAGGFKGIVPWFSGTTITQSLPKLEDTLLYAVLAGGKSPSWLLYKNSDHITGEAAGLSFVGYVQVAAMKSNIEMKKFARRVCKDMGVVIVDEGGFDGMVQFYSGVDNFQSYERLQSEIKSAANAPHSWAKWAAATLPRKVAETPRKTHTGFSLLAVRAPDGFCNGHPCRMLAQSAPQSQSHGMGKRASLDQAGYAQVAALKDDTEMKDFMLRMIDRYDCKVQSMGGLMGIVPWFSGASATQNIQKMEDTLLYAVLTYTKSPWLVYKNSDHITGDSARLGFVGYVQVAAMRSDVEMQKFARRVCKDMGVQIVDEGGFQGMVRFYSGTDNFQSYERMQMEIKSAANAPKAWAKWIKLPRK